MKIIPLIILMASAFLCSFIRDKIMPASSSPNGTNLNAAEITPSPMPTLSNKSLDGNAYADKSHKNSTIRTISDGILNSKAVSLPQPEYPAAARAVRASGDVSVHVLVDETGQVVSATVTSGHPLLHAAAKQAALWAKFSPTLLGGESVKVSGVIKYNFVP